jgi:hypothetical protein
MSFFPPKYIQNDTAYGIQEYPLCIDSVIPLPRPTLRCLNALCCALKTDGKRHPFSPEKITDANPRPADAG